MENPVLAHLQKEVTTKEVTTAQRHYALDWVRVLAFLLLIFFHSGMMFCTWDWHVKNPEQSKVFDLVMTFPSQWRLSLLFLVSGAGVFFALKRRTGAQFAKERFIRLFIPLHIGILFVIPPQVYFERLFQGRTYASFWDFYYSTFTADKLSYPEGNVSWHHLWFIAYLFVFSIISIPLFLWLRSESGKRTVDSLAQAVQKTGGILLFAIPLIISSVALSLRFETTHDLVNDWANFTFSILMFWFGYLIFSGEKFIKAIDNQKSIALSLAVILTIVLYVAYWIPDWLKGEFTPAWIFYRTLKVLNIWCVIVSILGYARKYLNFSNGFLKYANEAVYPFYILHQTITVAIGYYLIQYSESIAVNFPVVVIGTFAGCLLLYELLIRRVGILRLFFGLKMKRD